MRTELYAYLQRDSNFCPDFRLPAMYRDIQGCAHLASLT